MAGSSSCWKKGEQRCLFFTFIVFVKGSTDTRQGTHLTAGDNFLFFSLLVFEGLG